MTALAVGTGGAGRRSAFGGGVKVVSRIGFDRGLRLALLIAWAEGLCACVESVEPAAAEARSSPLLVAERPVLRTGLDMLTHFEELPILKTGARAGGVSSTAFVDSEDVSGAYDANDDYSNYLSRSERGRLLFDVVGSGAVNRFWHTDETMNAWSEQGQPGGSEIVYDFYLDDALEPSLRLSGPQLWRGEVPSFEAPLSLDANGSSGGSVSYRSISFARRLRIVASGLGYPEFDYYGIDYHLYADASRVVSSRGDEDTRAARALLERVGENPIPQRPEDVVEQRAVDLLAGSELEVGRLEGAGLITGFELEIPDLRREEFPIVEDDGRSTRAAVEFTVELSRGADAVTLVRRLADTEPQTGIVYIDGEHAGEWTTSGRGDPYSATRAVTSWLEAPFELPAALTANKREIRVRIEAARMTGGQTCEWNEFHYWVRSTREGVETETDVLDVGDVASERAHDYAIVDPIWHGTGRYRPLEPHVVLGENDARVLEQARIQMFWDGEAEPSVDVPIAEFFGTGAGFVAEVRALPIGHERGRFYSYFPMPFARTATIVLTNPDPERDLRGVTVSVRHRPYNVDFADVGLFHAERRSVEATSVGQDYELLSVQGHGHYVGANLLLNGVNWTLEGDEHIYIDGRRSPTIAGTGTEDYVNAGWYFSRGPFSAPFSGAPELGASDHPLSMYRFHITDYIPFLSTLRVAIEHDGVNANQVPYASVAYYYLNETAGLREVDALEPAEAASATAHRYEPLGDVRTVSVSGRFYADAAAHAETHTLSAFRESARFDVAIDAVNRGVVLRRGFDQAARDQHAEVYVDGVLAGSWYSAGGNDLFRFREDEFWIPAELTRDRAQLSIQLVVRSRDWNAYGYRVFALPDVGAF
jgi:Protein of unknown function (DUF2961)